MKKLMLFFLLAFGTATSFSQQAFQSTTATQSSHSAQASIKLTVTGITSHQLVFFVTGGSLSACSVKLEQSADNTTWSDLITAQTCTSNNSTVVTSGVANYVRVNPSTVTGTGTLHVNYLGFTTNSQDTVDARNAAINSGTLPANFSNLSVDTTLQLKGGVSAAGTLQAAITAAGANSTIVLPATYSETVTSPVVVSNANVTLRCEQGATVKDGVGGFNILTLGSNTKVEGCTFDRNGKGTAGDGYAAVQVGNRSAAGTVNVVVSGVTVKNTLNGTYGIRADNVVGLRVVGNFVNSNLQGPGITLLASDSNVVIANNVVDVSAAPITGNWGATAVEFKTNGTGGNAQNNISITGNSAITATGFCYEGGDFGTGGNPVSNVTVSGNSCNVKNTTGANSCSAGPASMACGGISISVAKNVTVSGNTYNAVGQKVNIAAIEMVGCEGCNVSNNVLYSDAGTNTHDGITLNSSIKSLVSGNIINSWGAEATSAGIRLILSPVGTHGDDNIITGNLLTFPSVVGMRGVYASCGTSGGTIQNTQISGNHFIGGSISTHVGVALSDGTGGSCTSSAYVSGNHFDNLKYGVLYYYATLNSGFNWFTSSVDTTFQNNGGGVLTSMFAPTPFKGTLQFANADGSVVMYQGAGAFYGAGAAIGTHTNHILEVYTNGAIVATFGTDKSLGLEGKLKVYSITVTGKAACVKSDKSIGYCSTVVAADGGCTCN